jgi:Fur family transcriptional regulator, peroxide stress response regulator
VNAGSADMERRLQHFKAVCKKAGVKLTPQRVEIFREVAGSLEHPDAEAIFGSVRRRMPMVSLDTVYRTLWLLNDLGVVTTLGPRRESVRFDANLSQHHHYVCTRCGLTRDFEGVDLGAAVIPAAVRKLGSIVTTRLEVRGCCVKCARPKTKGRRRSGASDTTL